MVDYKKSKIYQIIDGKTGQRFFGASAIDKVSAIMAVLKHRYRQYKLNKASFEPVFDMFFYGMAKILLVEKYPCDDYDELQQKLNYYIECNECVNKKGFVKSEEPKKKMKRVNKKIIEAVPEDLLLHF